MFTYLSIDIYENVVVKSVDLNLFSLLGSPPPSFSSSYSSSSSSSSVDALEYLTKKLAVLRKRATFS
jgi:hypothetical protein